ncbi:MAG: fluoride efflux transporter CrcB [Pseudomonadota bacterium]
MLITTLYVALGGALGAAARFLLGAAMLRATGPTAFPLPILTANVVGSLLMGIFVVLAAQRGWTHAAPFVMTGLLGGFTTFSAFSLETVTLIERGQTGLAAAYIGASVALSIGALMLGLAIARALA